MLLTYRGRTPRVDPSAFVAPTAVLIGDVEIGPESSIWFGAVLRGDHEEHGIRIGARTSIQDNCVLHVSARGPTVVGDEVTVGHGAVFESCEIRRGCLIGMNAVILHGAVIDEYSLVAALSVVPEGMHVPQSTLVAGVPARVRRQLTGESAHWVRDSAQYYAQLGRSYLAQNIGRAGGHADVWRDMDEPRGSNASRDIDEFGEISGSRDIEVSRDIDDSSGVDKSRGSDESGDRRT